MSFVCWFKGPCGFTTSAPPGVRLSLGNGLLQTRYIKTEAIKKRHGGAPKGVVPKRLPRWPLNMVTERFWSWSVVPNIRPHRAEATTTSIHRPQRREGFWQPPNPMISALQHITDMYIYIYIFSCVCDLCFPFLFIFCCLGGCFATHLKLLVCQKV